MSDATLKTAKAKFNLKKRLICDIISANLAAFSFNPFVNIIDSAVTSSQSGKYKVIQGIKIYTTSLIFNPIKYMKQNVFWWSFIVYSLTYTANNTIESICSFYDVSNFFPKFIGVSSINIVISLFKDAAFAKKFGVKLPSQVPMRSYLCWVTRDAIAITNAFIMPERIVKFFMKRKEKKSNIDSDKLKADKINIEKRVQVFYPLINLACTTPVNLLGLDYYNYYTSSVKNRAIRVLRNYPNVIPVTIGRMGSAYGIGGVNNITFRDKLISKVEGKNWNN